MDFSGLIPDINWELLRNMTYAGLGILVAAVIGHWLILRLVALMEKIMVWHREVEGEPPSESLKRIQTLSKLLRQAILLTYWCVVALILLGQMGVEIGPLLAGAGIVGLAFGFGAQNLVRDVISGFFMILENQIRVNDVAIINGKGGLVERINFRTTVLRDLTGTVHIFPNGTINTLSNMTNKWSAFVFEIGVAYKEDADEVIEEIKALCAEMKEDEEFGKLILEDPEVFGLDKFGDSAIVIKGRIKTKPIRQWGVGREFNRRLKRRFDDKGIQIPFPHRTLFFGENSDMVAKLTQQDTTTDGE